MRRDKKLLQDLSLLLPLGTVLILLGRGISCPGDIGEKSAVRERNEKKKPTPEGGTGSHSVATITAEREENQESHTPETQGHGAHLRLRLNQDKRLQAM